MLDNEFTGKFATSSPSKFKTKFLVLVVFPITEKSNPHLIKIFFAFSTFSEFNIKSILSWLSESIISYGVILSSLQGILFKFISIPKLPFEAISTLEEVNPAAPISCIEIIESSFISSKQASRRSFSVKGSPTCTVGFFASAFLSNSAEAILAPCIPSLPVLDPT